MAQINAWRRAGCAVAVAALLSACGGGGESGSGGSSGGGGGGGPASPPSAPPPSVTLLDNEAEVSRFLSIASFGATPDDRTTYVGSDAIAWASAQFNRPPTSMVQTLAARENFGEEICCWDHSHVVWDRIIGADDQLRQRMVFALSQILVISDQESYGRNFRVAYYIDQLNLNAFGNYRDLLEAVTYSPQMAEFLTYMRNRKADPNSGRMPDENYAREILQLFSIGLVELNIDGTVKTGSGGQPIETYTNDDIGGLAKVFTGLSYKGSEFWDSDDDAERHPLQVFPEHHSEDEKSFLGVTIPAGTSAEDSIDIALDTIFEHPNVGPFLSRQLIQRFTQSDPSPAYVARVATAFNTGWFTAHDGTRFGDGQRGSLEATLAAVILDQSVFDDAQRAQASYGKIREPILRFAHWARAFDQSIIDAGNHWQLHDTRDPTDRLGQHPFRSPSVFNFYRPGYVAPGTQTGAQGITAPELQIVNESTTVGYANFMTDFAFDRVGNIDDDVDSFVPDYTAELAMAEDPVALVDHLDVILTGGTMTQATKDHIVGAIGEFDIRIGEERELDDRERIVHLAVAMAVTAPSFLVQK